MSNNKFYEYRGPVARFGDVIERDWKAETWAQSEKKALSNLTYRYKRDHNMIPSTKVTLLGKLVERGI